MHEIATMICGAVVLCSFDYMHKKYIEITYNSSGCVFNNCMNNRGISF